jgi:hypothetical protein
MRITIDAARSMLRLSIWRRVEVYTVPVRTTAGGSYSELVEQPLRIAGVPVRIAAFKTEAARGSLFALSISNTPTGNLTFKTFIIPQHAQLLHAKPKLGTCASVRAKN